MFIKTFMLCVILEGTVFAEVVISPLSANVQENDSVVLTCALTGTATIKNFVWSKSVKGSNTTVSIGIITPLCQSVVVTVNTKLYNYTCPVGNQMTWTIKKVTKGNNGDKYRCNIETQTGNEDSNVSVINVQVWVSSVSMVTPNSSTITLRESTEGTFQCKTSGALPAALVTWFKDSGTPGDSRDDVQITSGVTSSSNVVDDLIEMTSTLKYSPSRNDNGWRIYCTASNNVGSSAVVSVKRPQLIVNYPPDNTLVITGFLNNDVYKVIDNTKGQLSCTITGGNPSPNLTWNCINSGNQQTNTGGKVTRVHEWIARRGQDRTCTCQSSHYSGNKTVSINIVVLYPPTEPAFIIQSTHVSGTIKVIKDNLLSVTCNSSGNPAPSYTWTKPNKVTSSGSELSVSNVQTNGRYTCDVRNVMHPSVGSDVPGRNTSFVDVLVLFPPSQPTCKYWNISGSNIPSRSIDVIEGDTFQVACMSTGEPEPSYYWDNLGNNSILTVTSITADRSSTCTARNTMQETVGQTLTPSATTTLKINMLYPPKIVNIKYYKEDSSVISLSTTLNIIEGNPFTVNCSSDSNPSPTYNWGGTLSSPSAMLSISKADRSQAGTITCYVENRMTRTFANPEKEKQVKTSKSLSFQVLYPPIIRQLRNESVVEGSVVTITCPVIVGYPPETTYEWSRDGTLWKTIQNFTINTVSRNDAMFYTCQVANSMQQTGEQPVSLPDTKSIFLNVLYNASVEEFYITGHKGKISVTMNENERIPFNCKVDSNPGSKILVNFEQRVLKLETNTKSLVYSIESATCTDKGEYNCIGYNQYNNNNSTKLLSLFVNCFPRPSPFSTLTENVTSAQNKSAVFTFTALAYPEPMEEDFKWYRWDNTVWQLLTNSREYQIKTSNMQSNLTIKDVNRSFYGKYKLEVRNDIGSFPQTFYLVPEDVPETPAGFRHVSNLVTQSSITLQWLPGFNNGLQQTFKLRFKKSSENDWTSIYLPDRGDTIMNYTINQLSSGTEYSVILYATNSLGNSSVTEILKIKTNAREIQPTDNLGLIAGSVSGGVAAAIICVLVFLIVRKLRIRKNISKDASKGSDRKPVYEDDDDYGLQDNPMYVSAGPRNTGASSSGGTVEYSTVNKAAKAVNIVNDNEYAVVSKPKQDKTKPGKKEKEKSKQGFFNDKKGKKVVHEGDIYENSPASEMKVVAKKDVTIYENPENSAPKKNVNKDGLIYADLSFNDQPKGQRKLVIHGLDSMTEYVEVDFTKKADPLPDSDDENIPPKN